MSELDRIVNVTITRETSVPAVTSFGYILIAAEFLQADVTPSMTERVREFTSLSAIGTAFGTDSIVYAAASAAFSQNPNPEKVFIGRKKTGVDGTETWDVALSAMLAENDEWYGVSCVCRTEADLETIADWIQANEKLGVLSDDDSNMISGTGDIAEYLETETIDRVAAVYHPDADGTVDDPFIDVAWLAKMLPEDPGSATWKFKQLSGVGAYALTAAQISTLEGKNGNYYTAVGGVNITQNGTVGTGEFLDVIHGCDWLKARIAEAVYADLVNLKKVPFTNGGIQTVVAAVKAVLMEGVDNGFLSDDGLSVEAPDVADVSAVDKAARNLPDVTFEATLAGAIHKVTINGTISL